MFPHIAASLSRRVVDLGAGLTLCLSLAACDLPDLNFFGGSDAKETTTTVITQTPGEEGADSVDPQSGNDAAEKLSNGDNSNGEESTGEGESRGGESRSGDSPKKTRAKGPDIHLDFEDMSDEDFFGKWRPDGINSFQPSDEELAAKASGVSIGDTITLGGHQVTVDMIGKGYGVIIGGSDVPVPDNLSSNLLTAAMHDSHPDFTYFRYVVPITLEVPSTSGSGTEKFRCVLLEDRTVQCSNDKWIKYYFF